MERITRNYYIPNVRGRTKEVIRKCHPCAQNKKGRHAPYGLMEAVQAPEGPWQVVTMDFIVKLPPSKEPVTNTTFDSVYVVTCKTTKEAHFIPYKEASNASDMAYTFIKIVVSRHGMPKIIISDRDKLFISKF